MLFLSNRYQTFTHLFRKYNLFFCKLQCRHLDRSSVKTIWNEYKTVVADGILSASASQSYEMAADIATSSGEEVGQKLVAKFDRINEGLTKKSEELNANVKETVST